MMRKREIEREVTPCMREVERAKAEIIYRVAFIHVQAEISQAFPLVQEGLALQSCIFNFKIRKN
jgi:hypothetical protein